MSLILIEITHVYLTEFLFHTIYFNFFSNTSFLFANDLTQSFKLLQPLERSWKCESNINQRCAFILKGGHRNLCCRSHQTREQVGSTVISKKEANFTAVTDGGSDAGCLLLSNTSDNANTTAGTLTMLFKIFIASLTELSQLFFVRENPLFPSWGPTRNWDFKLTSVAIKLFKRGWWYLQESL